MVGDGGMLVSNIGDSKAVVIRGEEMLDLTIEHNANNEDEKSSIEQKGGWIIEKKVNNHTKYLVQGTLEVTRSMGDRQYKKYITCEPDITEYKFHEKDNYVILASDGFWKVNLKGVV
jgi:serine/threonine protein phosphatase PrpC